MKKTSMRMIAENSGVTKPAVYYYFPDKESLFESIIGHGIAAFTEYLENIMSSDLSLRDKLVQIFLSRFPCKDDATHNSKYVRKFVTELFIGGLKFNLSDNLKSFFGKQIDFYKTLIDEGKSNGEIRDNVDSETVAYYFIGIVNIYSRKFYMLNENVISPDKVYELIDIMLEGIKKR